VAENVASAGIGLRHVRVAVRNATHGVFDVPETVADDVAYPGLQLSYAQALTVTVPEPQRVTVRGDDRAQHTFSLPPTDNPTGEVRVAAADMEAYALVAGLKMWGSPTVRKVGFASDKTGEEPAVILWGCREAFDKYTEMRCWQTYILLNAQLTPRPATMEDQQVGANSFSMVANASTKDELGITFSIQNQGFLKAPYIMVVTTGKFWIDAFRAGGATATFTLTKSAAEIAAVVGGIMNLTVDGAPAEYSYAEGVVTLTGGNPTADALIVVEYEYQD
jgi:hypothetical protein